MADKEVSIEESFTAKVYISIKVTVPTIEEASTAEITINAPKKRIARRIPS